MRLVGAKEARLVRELVARARARTGGGRGNVLRPFGLVERPSGFTELHAVGEALSLDGLRSTVRNACGGGRGAIAYEAETEGRDVLVIEVFAAGREPTTHVVPVSEPQGSNGAP